MSWSPTPPPPLDGLSVPLYERVRLAIQSRVANQSWDPAEPIPTEQALAKEFGVSVGTIRKAVERLAKDGLLVKIQGKGTFIRRPDFQNSLLRFFRYRDAGGKPVIPTGVVKRVDVVPAVDAINRQLNIDPVEPLVHLRRLRLVERTVVLSEKIWLPKSLFGKLVDLSLERFGNLLYPFYDEVCGQFVSSAIETLSFDTPHDDMGLGTEPGDLLVRIERVAQNIEGRPIEYRVSYGLPQNFRYEVRIN